MCGCVSCHVLFCYIVLHYIVLFFRRSNVTCCSIALHSITYHDVYVKQRNVRWCNAMQRNIKLWNCMKWYAMYGDVRVVDFMWRDMMYIPQSEIVWYGMVVILYGMVLYLYGMSWVLGVELGLVCMYLYIYIHISVCVCVFVGVCMCVLFFFVCVCARVFFWVCVCDCVFMHNVALWPVLQVCVKCGRPCANTQKAAEVCQTIGRARGANLGKRWFVHPTQCRQMTQQCDDPRSCVFVFCTSVSLQY